MGLHSRRGPSAAKRFRTCAGSLAMCDAIPKELRRGSSGAARLGTATHALIEHCLKKGKKPEDMRDRIILIIERENEEDGASILREGAKMPKAKADEFVFIIGDEMIQNAEVAADYVRGRCVEMDVDEKTLELETRTNPLPERDDTSGTADITIKNWPELLEVDDYKNGYLAVEHEDNDQAQAYLTGKAIESEWSFERYRAAIIQPNFPHGEGPVRWVEYTAEDLQEFQKKYRADIKRGEKAEKEFADGGMIDGEVNPVWADRWLKAGDHCTFCDAGATCPKRRELAEEQARIEFADEPKDLKLPTVTATGKEIGPAEIQVSQILKWAPFLDALIRSAELYTHRALEAGYHIPGFKLVARRSNRRLKEAPVKEIVAELVERGFVKKEDVEKLFTPRKLKTGPQIEKVVNKKLKKEFNEDFLTKPDNGTTVAPEDDRRPRVEAAIDVEFEEVTEDEEFDFG